MIPVALQPEPPDFDENVRTKGRAWLAKKGIAVDAAPPKGIKLQPYWSRSNRQLWDAYSGTCAYLAIYFEWPTGASSTDHFVAKSAKAGDAYEWNNYRLACLGPNRAKREFSDVLDPIGLAPETFLLNLSDGKMRPNPALSQGDRKRATATIRRLGLNDATTKQMRAKHFSDFLNGDYPSHYLRRLSPFVWYEANRQGLL